MGLIALLLFALSQPPNPLFSSRDLMTLEVDADLRTLLRERHKDDRPWRPALLRWGPGAGDVVTGELRAAGRQRRYACRFPPMRIRVPPGRAAGSPFADTRWIHIVTHCDRRDRARLTPGRLDARVLREYIGYRWFQVLAEPAPARGARLARVTWVDRGRRQDARLAVLLESARDLADRTGRTYADLEDDRAAWPAVDEMAFDDASAARFVAFELAIANLDVQVRSDRTRRNAKVLHDPGTGRYELVPYDFDLARLVWGARFTPNTWLRARVCRPGHWERCAVLPRRTEALRRALSAWVARYDALVEAAEEHAGEVPRDDAATPLALLEAWRALLTRDGGIDRVLERCFGR